MLQAGISILGTLNDSPGQLHPIASAMATFASRFAMPIAPHFSHVGRVGLMQPGVTCLKRHVRRSSPRVLSRSPSHPIALLRLHLADAVFHDERLTIGVADCLLHGMQVTGVEDESNHICR